jgi:4-hydroxy-tetrahydrodipicolinate synthase
MIQGIFAASITPLNPDFSPDLEAIPGYLDFLARRGCHGALLLGTTGEGPSFSSQQRLAIFQAALNVRQDWPNFRLLAGTGTPSLDETARLTQSAFDLGMDGVVLLPPFYYRGSGDEGLFSWYMNIIDRSVPSDGIVLAYHIPAVSGVGLSIDLLSRLFDAAPTKFTGLKDSSGDAGFAYQLGNRFGSDMRVFTGNDKLLSEALQNHASGCITALANLISPDLRDLWEAFQEGKLTLSIQERINSVREVCELYQPFPPLIKFLLNQQYDFPLWSVCPPLIPLPKESGDRISARLDLT